MLWTVRREQRPFIALRGNLELRFVGIFHAIDVPSRIGMQGHLLLARLSAAIHRKMHMNFMIVSQCCPDSSKANATAVVKNHESADQIQSVSPGNIQTSSLLDETASRPVQNSKRGHLPANWWLSEE
jgi:hypothetical protein